MSEQSFIFQGGDFAACDAAEDFLRGAGFSVGSMQRGAPRGIMFGDYLISKDRGLDTEDRAALHGQMIGANGSMRNGPVKVVIYDHAPEDAKRAFSEALLTHTAQP